MDENRWQRLKGRVALVTGAGSGVGLATATLFADHGAAVVMLSRDEETGERTARSIRESGARASYVQGDVTRTTDLQRAIDHVVAEFGGLDILVANAGVLGRASYKPADQVTDDEWSEMLSVNLTGVFNCFRCAIPAIRTRGGGSMTVTSSAVARMGFPGLAAYAAAKSGVDAMVRVLAVELAGDAIRVNGVAPGGVASNVERAFYQSKGIPEDQIERILADSARIERPVVQRLADPIEVAYAHLFLNSDEASLITGQVLVADAGWTLALDPGPLPEI